MDLWILLEYVKKQEYLLDPDGHLLELLMLVSGRQKSGMERAYHVVGEAVRSQPNRDAAARTLDLLDVEDIHGTCPAGGGMENAVHIEEDRLGCLQQWKDL